MRTLREYADLAKQRRGFSSDRSLSLALGPTADIISQYLRGRAWPSEEAMLRLAELAEIPGEEALLDLAQWRATASTRPTWQAIAAKLAAAAPAFLTAVLPTLTAAAFFASAAPQQEPTGNRQSPPTTSYIL